MKRILFVLTLLLCLCQRDLSATTSSSMLAQDLYQLSCIEVEAGNVGGAYQYIKIASLLDPGDRKVAERYYRENAQSRKMSNEEDEISSLEFDGLFLSESSWEKIDLQNEIEEMVSEKRFDEARMKIDEALEKYPDLVELKNTEFEKGGVADVELREKAEAATSLWSEYKKDIEANALDDAKKRLLEIDRVYGGLKDMTSELIKIDGRIDEEIKPKITAIKKSLGNIQKIISAKERLAATRSLLKDVEALSARYGETDFLAELDGMVKREMEKHMRIIDSIKDLD